MAAPVLTVVEPFHLMSTEPSQIEPTRLDYEHHARQQASLYLADAERRAKMLGVSCEVLQVVNEDPYQAIIETAERGACDLIAMASHGRRGVKALLLGSVTTKVLTHSKIPVLVYR